MNYTRFEKLVVFALLMVSLFSKVHGHDNNRLTIFVDNSYPPYMYELEGTKAEGLYPRLLEEITRQTGNEAEVVAVPWKRALANGASGIGAVGGAYKNDERVESYDYSAPLYQEKLVIFVHKENSFDFNDVEDLKGKVIGVNRGWSYGQKFDEARKQELFKVNIRANPTENFKMLALGRIDCLILDQLSGDSYVRLLGISEQVTSLPTPFSINNGHLIISKKLKMKEFIKDFDSALEQMQQNGTYNELVKKYVQGTISN